MDGVVEISAKEREQRREQAEINAAKRRAERERPGPKWFVVQCVGLSDKQVMDQLALYHVETYAPKTIEMKRVPRRKMSRSQRLTGHTIEVPKEVPLFPRYVFVNVDTSSREINGAISGDLSLVEAFDKDAVVRVFDVGETLIVDDGPFREFEGVVERAFDAPINKLDPNSRIRVAIPMFGRVTSVELAYWQVKKSSNS
jgi:transcription antitermination factor NusG